MTTCDRCGNSYSDGFDDVHRCPDPEGDKMRRDNRQLIAENAELQRLLRNHEWKRQWLGGGR